MTAIAGTRHRSPATEATELAPLASGPGLGTDQTRAADLGRPRFRMLAWFPLLVALVWLLGTFGAFWLTGLGRKVENPDQLCEFVLGATALFAGGYAAQVRRRPPSSIAATDSTDHIRRVRQLVLAGSVYYAVLSVMRLVEFGATGPRSLWTSIQTPATGYMNKLDVYQQSADNTSHWLTYLLPLSVLGTALVPLLVVYWRSLSNWLRLAGVVGIALYLAFFLFIGTMKGLADVVIMLAAGMLVALATARRRPRVRSRRRQALMLVAAAFALLAAYMVYNHANRAAEFGTEGYLVQANPTVEHVVGVHAAEGIAATIAYPTHGYLGLSYNLQVPFEWSHGLGSSPSAAMLAERAIGADPTAHPPYPDRTESQMGWPAGLYWATIYPWLASDLTFVGAALFMGLVGWLFARSWCEAVSSRRVVPILIFAQLGILIAYVPANNQLGMAPESIVGMATLLVLYAKQSLDGWYNRRRLTSGL